MAEIIAVSKLLRVKSFKEIFYYEFHFKGFYRGMKIKKIVSLSRDPLYLTIHDEYLLSLILVEVKCGKLISEIVRYRNLENISW